MRVHILQHVPFESPGMIEPWLAQTGARVSLTRFYESEKLPDLERVDFLISLGGPMSANDEAEFPWLVREKRCLAAAAASGKAVLGICLGAQLVASALGVRVYPNHTKEIGWFPIHGLPSDGNCFAFPRVVDVFHWHGETFDLPPGARLLASSAVCRHQAFQVGRRVLGLQFHLETTPESLDTLVTNCRNELRPDAYIQSESRLRSVPLSFYAGINDLMGRVLDYLTSV